jgi:ribose-phosphate pyrophosphokinase
MNAMTTAQPLWTPAEAAAPLTDSAKFCLFALGQERELGLEVAKFLGPPLAAHEERAFEDGEHKTRPLEAVAKSDVYVLESLHGGPGASANDRLCRLLFFIGALKDAGADRVTAITPYLCYARKDRRTKPNDPVNSKYVASLFEAVGMDAIVTLDVHNPAAYENAFRRRAVTLTAAPLFVAYAKAFAGERFAVVSPDAGGVKRAELFREALEAALGYPVGKGFADKHRSAGIVSGELFVGDVAGATVLMIDDLISTGTTLLRAAKAARKAGAVKVIALVTHALFTQGAEMVITDPAIDRFVVTDSVSVARAGPAAAHEKIERIAAAPLLAETIRRLHQGAPLTDLLVF